MNRSVLVCLVLVSSLHCARNTSGGSRETAPAVISGGVEQGVMVVRIPKDVPFTIPGTAITVRYQGLGRATLMDGSCKPFIAYKITRSGKTEDRTESLEGATLGMWNVRRTEDEWTQKSVTLHLTTAPLPSKKAPAPMQAAPMQAAPAKTAPKTSADTRKGKVHSLTAWGVELMPSPALKKKFTEKPKPHLWTGSTGPAMESYYFHFPHGRRNSVTFELRYIKAKAPKELEKLDEQPNFGDGQGYKGTKGDLRYVVGFKRVRGPGSCSHGRCMHMLVTELNGYALLPLTKDTHLLCHVYITEEDNPKDPDFKSLFDACLSLRKTTAPK